MTKILLALALLVGSAAPVVNVGLNNEAHNQEVNGVLCDQSQHTISWSGSGGSKAVRDGIQISALFYGPNGSTRQESWLVSSRIFFTQTGAQNVVAAIPISSLWSHHRGAEDVANYHYNYLGEVFDRMSDALLVGSTTSGKTFTIGTLAGLKRVAGRRLR